MVCDMVLVQVGYGMGFPYHGIGMSGGWYGFSIPWYHGIGMELIYHSGMGTLKVP